MGSNPSGDESSIDWRSEIVAAVAVQQACMRVDLDRLWDYPLPEVRASEEEIVRTEQQLGFRLPEQYRSFLLCANGWKHFYQNVSLFGTEDLLGGKLHDEAEKLFGYSKEDLYQIDFDLDDFFPFAVSSTQIDYFVLGKVDSRWEGQVVWIAGDVIDMYSTFFDYFRDMIRYNRGHAEEFAEEHHLEGEPRFEIPVFDDGREGGK